MAKVPLIQQMTEDNIQTIAKVNQISNKFFRDLIWLLYVPTISDARVEQELHFSLLKENMDEPFSWLNSLKIDDQLQPKDNLPLGKYAEQLIVFFLKHSRNYMLLAHNVQLIHEQQTIGELDFLFEDLTQSEFIHLEFAIKYYLKVEYEGKERFLGPSTKDWYKRKLEKLTTQQIRHTHNYGHLLNSKLQTISFLPKIIVKGALFYAYTEWIERKRKKHLIEGWWLDILELGVLERENSQYCIIRNKRDWIFPFSINETLMNYGEVEDILKKELKSRNELMLVRYVENGLPKDFGFVMRSKWPY